MVAAVKDDMMNDQMRNLKKWIYLRFELRRCGAEAWVKCWKRIHSSLEETPHAEGKKTSHCMKTGGFADWERNKVDGVRMSWGKKKVREATDSEAVSWNAVLRRGILFPVAVIISPSLNLLLNLEKLFLENHFPHKDLLECVWENSMHCVSHMF